MRSYSFATSLKRALFQACAASLLESACVRCREPESAPREAARAPDARRHSVAPRDYAHRCTRHRTSTKSSNGAILGNQLCAILKLQANTSTAHDADLAQTPRSGLHHCHRIESSSSLPAQLDVFHALQDIPSCG